MAPPPRRNPDSHGRRRRDEEPWLAAGIRPANFLPGLAIGFLLGLLLDLSSSWRPRFSLGPAPPPSASRGSKRPAGSSAAPDGGSGGEELKMVLVVRQDLKMGAGKIASQCAHAATGLYAQLLARELYGWIPHTGANAAIGAF